MPKYSGSVDFAGIVDGFTDAVNYTPSPQDVETAAHWTACFERAQDAKASYEYAWNVYQAYLKGDQLLYFDPENGEIVRLKSKKKRLYSVNNQLRPVARSLVGKLCRVIPSFSVVPATAEQDEVYGARVADAYLALFKKTQNFELKYMKMQRTLMWAGSCCIELFWDPDAGRERAYCTECSYEADKEEVNQPCPVCAQQVQEGKELFKQSVMAAAQAEQPIQPPPEAPPTVFLHSIMEGDVGSRVLDPRDVFVDPSAKEFEDARYVIIRTVMPLTEARRKYPQMGIHLSADSSAYMDRTNFSTYSLDSGTWTTPSTDEQVYMFRCYERPTETYPEGRVTMMCNKIILEERKIDYKKFKRFPLFWNHWERNEGEFWGECWIAQGWHRQKELNENETQVREHSELLARTKIKIPIGTRISADEITATTAQLLHYNRAAGEPDYMVPPPMPQEVFQRNATLKQDVRMQAGITDQEAGLSQADPNGRAMAIIEAEADQQIGPILKANIAEWGEFFRCLLILVKENYNRARAFVIQGDDALSTYSFEDMNLEDGWDLQLEVEDGLSRNGAIRLQQVMDLANAGFLTDPKTGIMDVRRAAKMGRLKIPGVGIDVLSTEYAAAQAMIQKIKLGEPVQPESFDDPTIFSEVMIGWLRGPGRRTENQQLKQQIEMVYQFYCAWAITGQMPMQGANQDQQGPSEPGQDQSAPGGSSNNPGNMPSDAMGQSGGTVGSDASQMVSNADASADKQAQVAAHREG